MKNSIQLRWYSAWSLDVRAIALSRICLGLVLIFDLATRFSQAHILYGVDAMVPPRMVEGSFPFIWNLYLLSDQLWYTKSLIILTLISATCWLIGYRAKLALIITWFLFASLFFRNTLIHSGAEPTLLAALFWMMWLPQDHAWSVNRSRPINASSTFCLSPGSVIFILQVVIYYFFSGLHKNDPIWWQEGTAIYYALNLETFASDAGTWLLNFPTQTQMMSWAVFYIELFAPLLLIVLPILFGIFFRTIAVAILIALHLGIAIFMDIWTFPYINIAILLALLPLRAFHLSDFKNGSKRWDSSQIVVFAVLLTLLAAQAIYATLRYVKEKPPSALRYALQFVPIENSYRYFAPRPHLDERFWLIEGVLENDQRVNVVGLDSEPIPYVKDWALNQWDRFHQRYFVHMVARRKRAPTLRAQYGHFLCQRWQAWSESKKHAPLAFIQMRYITEWTSEWNSGRGDFQYLARGYKIKCRR